MSEGTDQMFENESVPSFDRFHVSSHFIQIFRTYNSLTQNGYCNHRNFDSVNQPYISSVSQIPKHLIMSPSNPFLKGGLQSLLRMCAEFVMSRLLMLQS